MIILEEVNLPHPWFPWCYILLPWRALNGRRIATAQCSKGAERNRRRMAEEGIW